MRRSRGPLHSGGQRCVFILLLRAAAVVAGCVSLAAGSAAAEATRNGPLPVPLPLFPPSNWWNLDISTRRWTRAPRPTSASSARRGRPHPDFGGNAPGAAGDLRHPLRRRGQRPAAEGGGVRVLGRERRREPADRPELPLLPDPRRGDHAAVLDRGRVPRRSSASAATATCSSWTATRKRLFELFALCWDGSQLDGGLGRVLRHEHQQPPAGGMDLGRRRGPGHPARARALRRGLRPRRDRPRLPLHRARDQRPHLARLAHRGQHGGRAARWARGCG